MATSRAAVTVVLLLGACVMARAQQDLTKGSKDRVFIGDLSVAPSVTQLNKDTGKESPLRRISDTLKSQFTSALNGTGQFELLNRDRLDAIREEQKLTLLGQIDPNDKNAAQALKLAGAKFALLPQLDAFEDRSEVTQFQQVGRTSMKRKLFLSCVVQIVDTTKGTLLPDSPSVQLEKYESVEMAQQGAPMASDQVLLELAKDMANQLCQQCVNRIRPAKVLTVTGKQIMINRGTAAGFKVGAMVEIYAGQEVVDEDTGEKFVNEVPVGQAKVVRAEPKQSYAMIEGDDMGIQKGCVVRVLPAPAANAAPLNPAGGGSSSPGSSEKPLNME